MWYYAHSGQQAGPLSKPDLLAMLRDGRLARETMVWQEGMAEWRRAEQVDELAEALGTGMLPQPPAGVPYVQPPATNGLAIASMILGICSYVVGTGPLTAIPAVICGHIARKQIRSGPVMQTGDGMAVTGLVLGYLMIVLTLIAIALIVLFFGWFLHEMSSMPPSAPPVPTGPMPVPPGAP